jgi:L-ascorbate metabolism protein UlaG (beta-lactamase superfamily)
MVHITYLGTAGWHLTDGDYNLVIDPYFTRLSMSTLVFGRAVPDTRLIEKHMPPADALLVTHPHYDHIMDVPEAARITGAPVWASPQGCELLQLLKVPDTQICAMNAGDVLPFGPFSVEVYESQHRIVFGSIPYSGPLKKGVRAPLRGGDYRMDVQYSFRVTVGDQRILVTSGVDDEPAVEAEVILVGADTTRDQLAKILNAVRPRFVLPNHWDDMFRPLSKPTRTMMTPPPTRIPIFKRINLEAWRGLVDELAPDAQILIPRLFEAYSIA